MTEAHRKLPALKARVWIQRGKKLDLERKVERRRAQAIEHITMARRQLDEMRIKEELLDVIEKQLAPLVEKVATYQRKTERLGGRLDEPVLYQFHLRQPGKPSGVLASSVGAGWRTIMSITH